MASRRNFEKGEEYELAGFPFKLEEVGEGEIECRAGDEIVTFEYSKMRCVDVTHVEDIDKPASDR